MLRRTSTYGRAMKPKVLISFLMPFPIRGVEAPYLWVFYKQLSMFAPDEIIFIGSKEYRIFPDSFARNRFELDQKSAEHFGYDIPDIETIESYRFIECDDSLFSDIQKSHGDNANAVFTDILLHTNEYVITRLTEILTDLIDNYEIAALLSWCNIPSLVSAAQQFSIPVIHNELGALRSPTYTPMAYFDFRGVNGNTDSERRFGLFKEQISPSELLSIEQIREVILYQNLQSPSSEKRDVGVALQVEDDSNILAFSNGFDSLALITWVKTAFPNKSICIREHPAGYLHYDKLGEIDTSINSLCFLSKCDTIVTINSSLALEALVWGKKPLILGDNPFKFITSITDEDELLCALNFALFAYMIPYEFLFDRDYYHWRLHHWDETDIFRKHIDFYRTKRSQTPFGTEIEVLECISKDSKHFLQLFVDTGDGISEESSIKIPIDMKHQTDEYRFDLSRFSDIQALRFDPLNDSCVIEIESLELIYTSHALDITSMISTRVCSQHGKIYFFEFFDPMIYFEELETKLLNSVQHMVARIRYLHVGKEAIDVCIHQILEDKRHETSLLHTTYHQLLHEKEAIIAQKKSDLEHQQHQLIQKENEAENLKNELAQLYASKSWRITSPLRTISRILNS